MEELPELALQRILQASLQGNTINRLQISESVRAGRPTSEVDRFSNILNAGASFEWDRLRAEKGFVFRGVGIDFTSGAERRPIGLPIRDS